MAVMCLLLALLLLALAAPTSLSPLPHTLSGRASTDPLSQASFLHAHRGSFAEHGHTTRGAVGAQQSAHAFLDAHGAVGQRASSGLRLRGGGGKKAKARAKAARMSVDTFGSSFTKPGSGDGAGAHLLGPNYPVVAPVEKGDGDEGVWKEVRRKGRRKELAGRTVGGQRVVIDGSNVVKEGGGKVGHDS